MTTRNRTKSPTICLRFENLSKISRSSPIWDVSNLTVGLLSVFTINFSHLRCLSGGQIYLNSFE